METVLKIPQAFSSIGKSPVERTSSGSPNVKGGETDALITACSTAALGVICVGGVLSAVVSMAFYTNVMVDLASITVLALAPYAVYQKKHLARLGSMRGHQNALRKKVNSFSVENKKLTNNLNEMEKALVELKDVDKELKTIAKKAGGQADRLVSIIDGTHVLQTKIKKQLEAQVLQSVLSMVLSSDKDMNFTFTHRELIKLRLRLSHIPGVQLDEGNWKKHCGDGSIHLHEIMRMFRNLKDDIPEEENIFHLLPDTILHDQSFRA